MQDTHRRTTPFGQTYHRRMSKQNAAIRGLSTDIGSTIQHKHRKRALNPLPSFYFYLVNKAGWKLTYRAAFSRIAGLLKPGSYRP